MDECGPSPASRHTAPAPPRTLKGARRKTGREREERRALVANSRRPQAQVLGRVVEEPWRDDRAGRPEALGEEIGGIGGHAKEGGDNDGEISIYVFVLTLTAAMGGFLFGYDTGVISGAMLQIKTARLGLGDLSSSEQELVVSSTVAAAIAGSLASGEVQRRLWLGRRGSILAGGFWFVAGTALMVIAWDLATLTGGRTLVGLAVGMVSHSVPLYISECAPPNLRGRLNTANNVCITLGQTAASVVCCVIARSRTPEGWRYMFGIGAVPAVCMVIGFLFLPESPRYILLCGQDDDHMSKAKGVLQRLRGNTSPAKVSEELQLALEALGGEGSNQTPLMELCSRRSVRRALVLGCSLQLLQQLSGINTMMYYAATILQMSSSGGGPACGQDHAAPAAADAAEVAETSDSITDICMSAWVCSAQVLGTLLGMAVIDSMGRRPVILGSLAGVSLSLLVLGASFHGRGVAMGNAPLMAMIAYLVCFGLGMSAIPWVVNSEIYPVKVRSTCIGIATACNWTSNFVVAATFLNLAEWLSFDQDCPEKHPDGVFWLYGLFASVGFAALALTMPETKGLTLEEITERFEDAHQCSPCCT